MEVFHSDKIIPILVRFVLACFFQDNQNLQGTHNAARKLLDGVTYISESVTAVGAKPTKVVTSWMADQIAPSYWVPNLEITVSHPSVTDWSSGLVVRAFVRGQFLINDGGLRG